MHSLVLYNNAFWLEGTRLTSSGMHAAVTFGVVSSGDGREHIESSVKHGSKTHTGAESGEHFIHVCLPWIQYDVHTTCTALGPAILA